jgi:hypothetical protein
VKLFITDTSGMLGIGRAAALGIGLRAPADVLRRVVTEAR